MSACRITRLRLFQFRNHAETTIEPGPGLNLFSGRNAQGKTNLLEAVATLTLTRSPRTTASADLISWGTTDCQVEAAVSRPSSPADLAVRFSLDAATRRVSRSTTMDGKPRPARSLLGVCPVVLFWPDDLQLVKAGPEGRRRLLDVVLSQLDPRTATDLLRYRRSLEQRNALLRQLRDGGPRFGGHDQLEAFDAEFAEHGARIRLARRQLVAALAPLAGEALAEFAAAGEELELDYLTSDAAAVPDVVGGVAANPGNLDDIRAGLLAEIARRRADELARGQSLVGPHRDDIEIKLGGRPARSAGSQGQQRSVVLALKLAEVRYIQGQLGIAPILILDDVLSELDGRRRDALLSAVAAADLQVLVTSAEPRSVGELPGGTRSFEVDAGSVRSVSP